MNWKALIMGGIVFWILALIFTYAGFAAYGNFLAALIAGFIAVWMAGGKGGAAAITGAITGIIGGIIIIALGYAGLGAGAWAFSLLGNTMLDTITLGLILAAIGGIIAGFVKK